MPYIPKNHEKYDLLPRCREEGGEVFNYPGELICEVERLGGSSCGLFPYGYDSYEDYYGFLATIIEEYHENPEIRSKLIELRDTVQQMNQKEEWSILHYVGPTDIGLTHGKNYYWPSSKANPVYDGVIDDEEFTAYIYPTTPQLWRILEDPTGMAYNTIFQMDKGYVSQEEYDDFLEEIKILAEYREKHRDD